MGARQIGMKIFVPPQLLHLGTNVLKTWLHSFSTRGVIGERAVIGVSQDIIAEHMIFAYCADSQRVKLRVVACHKTVDAPSGSLSHQMYFIKSSVLGCSKKVHSRWPRHFTSGNIRVARVRVARSATTVLGCMRSFQLFIDWLFIYSRTVRARTMQTMLVMIYAISSHQSRYIDRARVSDGGISLPGCSFGVS